MKSHFHLLLIFLFVAMASVSLAQNEYQRAPREVLDLMDSPATPLASLSPDGRHLLLIARDRYPSIAELAQPMLPLAGLRINPRNNGPHRVPSYTGIAIQEIDSGKQRSLKLPPKVRVGFPSWSPDGRQFAFVLYQPNTIELWIADAQTGKTRQISGVRLNAAYGSPFKWMRDSRTLLCRTIPEKRGAAPAPPLIPEGPGIQENDGKNSPSRTYQDLLKNAHDDALFEYYITAQLALIDSSNGKKRNLGAPSLFATAELSPDGKHFLVTHLQKPFSRMRPVHEFGQRVEVWDYSGKMVSQLQPVNSEEGVPIEGVVEGPRSYRWRPTAPATLIWLEALDGGDPNRPAEHRDRIMALPAPFTNPAEEIFRLEYRFSEMTWGRHDGMALVSDYDRERRWTRTFLLKFDKPEEKPRKIWDRSARDRYGDPGTPLMQTLPSGEKVIWQMGASIYLDGAGASPRGDFPFLDRLDLETLQTERLFQSDDHSYESVIALVDDRNGVRFITRHESRLSPPNYFLRNAGGESTALTKIPDTTPHLRQISQQLVTYQREDGVPLSFTLLLPPGHQPGQRLPTVLWAYPREYSDAGTAGQISGSTNRFTTLIGEQHLFFLTQGYAILEEATMPIVGPPKTMNDTFVEQIVANARAAINKAVELGVTDPDRVGVCGHSYGAFMTVNLLAHSDLFKAGIGLSGAYNRTLTPFGFQWERRTLWEARETYFRMSPFLHVEKINEPLLLVHGEVDNNSGTFTMQSERLYHAMKGNGGHVRYVSLPYESHSYAARESVEHAVYEMIKWFDRHVKQAKPREVAGE